MKKLWWKIKGIWQQYWKEDESDRTKAHLGQSDKRSLWYGGFMLSLITITACMFITGVNNIRISRENAKDVEQVMNMIAAYLESATDDEYEEIAKEIRHDLIFREYGRGVEKAIEYIPNTAESCSSEPLDYPARLSLLCPNTGELYALDTFEITDKPEESETSNSTKMDFGYDEISETTINVIKSPGQKSGTATIHRKRGIVSLQKMKKHFCDDCIKDILNTVKNALVEEVVIFDMKEKKFYPVEEGTLRIGDCDLQISCENGNYTIGIEYATK